MKSVTSITIDTDILSEVRYKRINLSQTVNTLLREYLQLKKEEPEDKEDEKTQVILLKAKLANLEQGLEKKKKEEEKKEKDIVRWRPTWN